MVQENLSRNMPLGFQPAFQNLMQKMMGKVNQLMVKSKTVELHDLVESTCDIIQKQLPDSWYEFAGLVYSMSSQSEGDQNSIKEQSFGVFSDKGQLERTLDLRQMYFVELIKPCITGV